MRKLVLLFVLSLVLSAGLGQGCSSIKIRDRVTIVYETDWLMAGGSTQRSNVSKSNYNFSFPLKEKWSYNAESGFPSYAFAVSDAVLFASTLKGELLAIDISTGSSLGKYSAPGRSSLLSPVIRDNRMITFSSGNDDFSVMEYDYWNGENGWKKKVDWVKYDPVIIDNALYFSAGKNLYNVNAVNGKTNWIYSESGEKEMKNFTSVAVLDSLIIAGNENGFIYALDKEGNLKWKYGTGGGINSQIGANNKSVYAGSDDNFYYRIDAEGKLKWKSNIGTKFLSGASFYGETVITAGVDGFVYALGMNDGSVKWKFGTRGIVSASPLVHKNIVFVCSYDRNLYALNAETGELVWKYEFEYRLRTSPVIWKDYLVIGCDDRFIYCFK